MIKIVLTVSVFSLAIFTSYAQGWGQTQKIVPNDRFQGQFFGYSVAMDGDYAVVGMNNNSTNDEAGAYVFKNDGTGNWVEIQKLGNPNYHQFDNPGHSVAICGDYIFVSDRLEDYDAFENNFISAAGAVYIFKNDGNDNWNYIQKIVASDRETLNQFSWSVSISGDYAIIGSGIQDYDESGTNYIERAGAAYIFERDGAGTWNEVQKIVAPVRNDFDYFGRSVAINGNYAVVGAFQEDEDVLEGDTISSAGSAYIFERDGGGIWNLVQKIVASDREQGEYFGFSVSIDGNDLVVGASQEFQSGNTNAQYGAAYVFERNGSGMWNEVQKIRPDNLENGSKFGFDLDIDGNNIIVGAHLMDVESVASGGAAFMFEKDGVGSWNQVAVMYDPNNTDNNDYFGYAVALSGGYATASVYLDDQDQNNENDLPGAGSAFIFDINEPNTLPSLNTLTVVESNFKSTIKAYPNPTENILNLDFGALQEAIKIKVNNILGQEVYSGIFTNRKTIQLELNQPEGLYFVEVIIDSQMASVLKIVKH